MIDNVHSANVFKIHEASDPISLVIRGIDTGPGPDGINLD